MKDFLANMLNSPDLLEGSQKKISNIYLFISVVLIFFTPILLYIELVSEGFYQKYSLVFSSLDNFIILFFTIDLLLRIYAAEKKSKYFFSINGVIDVLSVVPEWIAIYIGAGGNSAWLRVLRLFRVGKLISAKKGSGFLSGFTGVVAVMSVAIISVKVLVLIIESFGWLPEFENISLVLGLVSFSLAMLLGTKLSVVNGRLNDLEDSLTSIVAGIKVFWFTNKDSRPHLRRWITAFHKLLKNPDVEAVSNMRKETNLLYESIGDEGINPNLVNFSRDVAFVTNTSITEVNPFYEKFLKEVTIVFTVVVVGAVPGITGLVASLILSYIFFGMFFLIEDMDHPLDYSDESLITVNLDPLEELIENLSIND
mgnify:CR=1 FL=1|tara:strand:- start:198 stop:1301 length:1104 start_codon:yes stop_codon:yes gene_type:complete